MPHADVLLTLAEIGIGLAGFSGVVASFGHRGRLAPPDTFRFLSAFAVSIFLTSAAMVPVALHHVGLDAEMVWRLASALGILYVIVGTPLFYRFGRRLAPAFREAGIPATSPVIEYAGRLFLVVCVVNVAGWPLRPGFGLFFASLALLLLIAAYVFAMIVVYRPGIPGDVERAPTAGSDAAEGGAEPAEPPPG